MEDLNVIILAAGEGTRMKSKKPKVLHEILNKTMLDYVIDEAKICKADNICVVVGHKADEVKVGIKNKDVNFVLQSEQLGTGHAVMQAKDFIGDGDVIILYGDTPLVKAETLNSLLEFHRKQNNGVSIISAIVDNPAGYGHIIRDANGQFLKNIEHKDASVFEKQVKEINTGIYCFKADKLKESLKMLKNDNVQGEYYLPDTLELILKSGCSVDAMVADDFEEFLGVNSKVQLAQVTEIQKLKVNKKHMENGVIIIDPNNTYIDSDVKIGMDTIIYPGSMIEKGTVIGEDCKIGPSTRLTNVKVGNNTTIKSSTCMDSNIGDNSTVGPYAYIRPNSVIGKNVKIGDFVEVKNSVIDEGTKVSHLTYIGDSDVGKNINFGCGTVTVNYDGKNKFRTTIEDDAFIGCNTNLIAPVTVKKGSYSAAGSTITKEVPEDALAVARARQQNILGWVSKNKN